MSREERRGEEEKKEIPEGEGGVAGERERERARRCEKREEGKKSPSLPYARTHARGGEGENK